MKKDIQLYYPLLPSQWGIFYHALRNDDYREVYTVQHQIRFPLPVNQDALQQACQFVINYNDILRASLVLGQDNIPKMNIKSKLPMTLRILDLTAQSHLGSRQQLIDQDRKQGFDLFKLPLFRFTLLTEHGEPDVLLWTFHHILIGGDSMVIMRELLQYYHALLMQTPIKLAPLCSYRKFIQKWHTYDIHSGTKYWQQLLNNYINDNVFLYNKKTAVGFFKQQHIEFSLSRTQVDDIKSMSQRIGFSMNILIQTAWGILLNQYFGQSDVVFGIVRAYPPALTQGCRGPFYHTFPVRLKTTNVMTITDLLREIYQQNVKMKSLIHTHSGRNAVDHDSTKPLFNTIVEYKKKSFQHFFHEEVLLQDHEFNFNVDSDMTVCLEIIDEDDTIAGRILYDSRILDADYANQLYKNFAAILTEMANNINVLVSDIKIEAPDNCGQVRGILTQPQMPMTSLARQIAQYPRRTCLAGNHYLLNYNQLEHESRQLALYLQNAILAENSPIAIFIGERRQQIMAALGIILSGHHYVPLDVTWPLEKISHIIASCQIAVICCDHSTLSLAAKLNSSAVLLNIKDLDFQLDSSHKTEICPQALDSSQLAYIIFTSGTTGFPKGVKISHHNMWNTILTMNQQYAVCADDAILALSQMSFDLSVYDVFGMLYCGAKIVIANNDHADDPIEWVQLMLDHQVTIWNSVPAYMQMLLAQLVIDSHAKTAQIAQHLRLILLSGDKIEVSLLQQIHAVFPQAKLICLGGATEGSIWSIQFNSSHFTKSMKTIPYGKALLNQSVAVLDSNLKNTAYHEPGEIAILGYGVAAGYVGAAVADKNRFLIHPESQQKLYLTGDLGYRELDNNIIIIGRKDTQVKLNGYRIELQGIEYVINRLEGVQCVVDVVNGTQLTLYYVSHHLSYTSQQIIAHCRRYLPEYMIPNKCVCLPKLPVTANGKIDRKVLMSFQQDNIKHNTSDLNPILLQQVRDIYISILGVEDLTNIDSIFNYGIDSVRSIQILAGLNQQLNINLAIRDIFEYSTVCDMVRYIQSHQKKSNVHFDEPKLLQLQREIQTGIWYAAQYHQQNGSYNVPVRIDLYGAWDMERLQSALRTLISQNQIFSQYFQIQDNTLQFLSKKKNDSIKIPIIDIGDLDPTMFDQIINKSANIPFNLAEPPLYRIEIFKCKNDKLVVLFCTHHILFDHASLPIFIDQLHAYYEGDSIAMPYQNTKQLQQQPISQMDLDNYVANLKTFPPAAILYDKVRQQSLAPNAGYLYSTLSIDHERMSEIVAECVVTPFMLFLTTFQLLISNITGHKKHMIGMAVSCRQENDSKITMLTNTVPLSFNLIDNESLIQLLRSNKIDILDALHYKSISWYSLSQKLCQSSSQRQRQLRIMFVFLEVNFNSVTINNRSCQRVPVYLDNVKFDIIFFVTKCESNYSITIEYNKQHYKYETMDLISRQYQLYITELWAKPNQPISKVLQPSDKDTEYPLSILQGPSKPAYLQMSIPDLFGEICEKYANCTAISDENITYTYAQLAILSDSIAMAIQQAVKDTKKVVAVAMCRSPLTIAVILAIWKTGNIYFYLDMSLPESRINYMIQQAQTKLVIYEGINENIKVICQQFIIDIKYYDIHQLLETNINHKVQYIINTVSSHDPAYIIFTSGTTGVPKQICLPHKTIVNLVFWQQSVNQGNDQIIGQLHAFNFDVSLQEICYALLHGKQLFIIAEDIKETFLNLSSSIIRHRINKLYMPTPLLDLFCSYVNLHQLNFTHLNEIIVAGDQLILTREIRKMVLLQTGHILLTNQYGPSETHVITSYSFSAKADYELPAIGRPIANTKISLKSKSHEIISQGFPGELNVSSDAISLSPEATIVDYPTGDLVRWEQDNQLHFIGRIDAQVKISGYRVNLSEIHLLLSNHEAVLDTYIIAINDPTVRLHAFVHINSELSSANIVIKLRSHLQSHLPHYMIPVINIIEDIPYLKNGKVDVQRLEQLVLHNIQNSKISFDDPLLADLYAILSEDISIDKLDLDVSYFDVGGNSFKALHLIHKIEQKLGISITLDMFMRNANLRSLHQIVSNLPKKELATTIDNLVLLRKGSSQIPLVLIHPIGGTLFCFNELLQYLPSQQTIIGFQDPYLFGERSLSSVHDLSSYYVKQLLQRFNEYETFILCGASFGSIVAAEMSLLLKNSKKHVPYIGIFDGWALSKNMQYEFPLLDLMMQYDFTKQKRRLDALPDLDTGIYNEMKTVRLQHLKFHYISTITSPIHIFQSIEELSPVPNSLKRYHGWDQYTTNNIAVYPVEGNHETMFQQPNVFSLAQALISSLQEVNNDDC